jgi:hypothetical protein
MRSQIGSARPNGEVSARVVDAEHRKASARAFKILIADRLGG